MQILTRYSAGTPNTYWVLLIQTRHWEYCQSTDQDLNQTFQMLIRYSTGNQDTNKVLRVLTRYSGVPHRVQVLSVITLAKPKSVILRCPSRSSNRFSGFRSLCARLDYTLHFSLSFSFLLFFLFIAFFSWAAFLLSFISSFTRRYGPIHTLPYNIFFQILYFVTKTNRSCKFEKYQYVLLFHKFSLDVI